MHIDTLLVLYNGGWLERTKGQELRVEATLGLGALPSPYEAARWADRQLDVYATARTEIAVGVEPAGEADTPYLAYRPGDTVTYEAMEERVVSMAVNIDNLGHLTFAPTLRNVLLTEQERIDQAINRFSKGALRGDSQVATPVNQIGVGGKDCCPPAQPFICT